MPTLSQDAIRELRQTFPLLTRLQQGLSSWGRHDRVPSRAMMQQLQRAYDRISELISPTDIKTWVGDKPPPIEQDSEPGSFALRTHEREQLDLAYECAIRLYLYVKEILQTEEVEEILNHLAQENASLKEQLAELRRRESTYLSTIREAQISIKYSLPPKSREILLDSLQRQHTTLTKNLCRLQEIKAQHGLSTPLDILNAIDQTQEDLERIEASIADLKDSKTDTN